MGNFLSDRTYKSLVVCQTEQTGGISWCSTDGTVHPHIDVVENFNPNLLTDPFRWIPQGLFQDLRDNTPNETIVNLRFVNDAVTGYTNAQMFSAFQNTIFTLQDYRLRLIQQNPTNPTSGNVTNLFFQYRY